ncbi:group 1 glycosyl transferase [Chondrocystis sp. NIES-4102]|nr:group 1 glycosyl transferase [Chondrocystis sp. NIES-4102]
MYKLVLIHPSAGVNWNGNSENFAIELARRLDNYFEVELLSGAECGSFSRPIKSISRSDASDLISNPLISRLLQKWFNRPEMAIEHLTSFLPCVAYLLKHPANLIFPQNDYGGLFVATCVRALKGTPILFTEHNSLLQGGKYLKSNLALKPDRLIVLNPEVAKYVTQINPQQPVNVIPYGIDLSEFTPTGKVMLTGLPQPTVLCVAPLTRQGNERIELTIEAVSRLPNVSLLICGNGIDRDYFQAMGDRLLGSQRFQIRSFAYAQMPQVYRSANVFTLASIEEPRGLNYIEAMACGLPVVTTDVPVRRYLIGEGGITCDVSNLDIYAQSLQLALEKYWEWQPPQQNAQRFSWQEITQLYRQAIIQTISHSYKNFFPLSKRA